MSQTKTKQAAHTPGPWKVVDRRDMRGNPCGWAVWPALERPYLDSPRGNQICATPDGTTREAEANARLIAASPDLLKACQIAENWMGELDGHDDPMTGISGVVFKLRAAIAIATS